LAEIFNNFQDHEFVKNILSEGDEVFKGRNIDIKRIEFEPDPPFNEYEFYIYHVGYRLFAFIHTFDQLEYTIDFLTNYDYKISSKKNRPDRIDYLSYTIENFYIRYTSLLDRLLQLINAVFHLCISEDEVSYKVIIKNLKVKQSNSRNLIKKFRKGINQYRNRRDHIIHIEPYKDEDLWKLRLWYLNDDFKKQKNGRNLLQYRSQKLREYTIRKKEEFVGNIKVLRPQIIDIFDELLIEFKKQKEALAKIC